MLKQRLKEDVVYLIKITIVYLLLVIGVYVASGLVGDVLQEREKVMMSNNEMIPSAILEFVGMQKLGQFPAKMEVFFVGLMILNLVVMASLFVRGVSAMYKSHTNGRFSFLFMQIMPLWKNYILTMGEILITCLFSWGLYILIVMGFGGLLVADMHVDSGVVLQELLGYMGTRGISLVLFMVALGMMFGTAQRQRVQPVDLSLGIIAISFVLGNLYKIPQYVGYTQVKQMIAAQKTMEIVRVWKQLRIVCPFSWLNPINIYNGILDSSQLWGYLLLAVLILVMSGLWYCKRDWTEV